MTLGRRWPTAIDLFCGAGGLSLGLRQARFRIVGALDISPLALESYRLNFPRVPTLLRDIRDVTGQELLEHARLGVGELDLLAGCPPCQGFSALRTKHRQSAVQDQRNGLILDFLRLATDIQPRFVLMENVPGLAADDLLREFTAGLQAEGYKIDQDVLNAADFGVPQRRRRFVLVAAKEGSPQLASGNLPQRTVRDSIGDLADTAGISGDQLHDHGERRSEHVRSIIEAIPKGGSRADLNDDLQLDCHVQASARGDGWWRDCYGRVPWDDLAPTITGGCVNPSKGRFLHPERDRSLTLREALSLQGFPRDYRLSIQRGKFAAADLIGNAIPPPFVKAQGQQLQKVMALR